MEGMGRAPEILDLETNDDIGLPDHRARAFALVERMPRREIHTAAKIDHGALQDAGEFNEPINTGLGASAAISNDHWIGRANQELGGFRNRAWIANQRCDSWTLWNDELLMWRNRRFLQLGIEHEKDWRHWRRHGDVVGPRCRLAEMRERTRQIIPFDEVAHRQGGILRRMDPISTR